MMCARMWGLGLIFVSCVAVQVASHETKLECEPFYGFPPYNDTTPSKLEDLKVELVPRENLNISWAVHIDGSIKSLEGTRISINSDATYHCKYIPPLKDAHIGGSEKIIWFHHVFRASYGKTLIDAANLPMPWAKGAEFYKEAEIDIPKPPRSTPKPVQFSTGDYSTLTAMVKSTAVPGNFTSMSLTVNGGVAGLMILIACYIIYKNCGTNLATGLGFKMLPTSQAIPVPVLVVYPAETSVFQQAVVALAEFLQWHGGCSVAVDMWQQGKIAELGPMHWLAEQAKAVERVLIVCPQASSQPIDSPHNRSVLSEPSIPAAAHDLYPLILNTVASHAKSTSDLAKFWVVRLGEKKAKEPSNLPPELRACKTFCLMKDLNKLCRSLHTNRRDGKEISKLILKPEIEKRLREAVGKLGKHQQGIFTEAEPLKSVVIV